MENEIKEITECQDMMTFLKLFYRNMVDNKIPGNRPILIAVTKTRELLENYKRLVLKDEVKKIGLAKTEK